MSDTVNKVEPKMVTVVKKLGSDVECLLSQRNDTTNLKQSYQQFVVDYNANHGVLEARLKVLEDSHKKMTARLDAVEDGLKKALARLDVLENCC